METVSKSIFFPGLNGLRAFAAISVLMGHTFQPFFADWGFDATQLPIFGQGVTLFFVISGFLITYLLLVEKERTKTVSIPKFYVRRILRIWPLYYLYIALCVLALVFLGRGEEIVNGNMWWYAFFCANVPFIASTGTILLVHLWSIGVEEQFYLIWPWIVKHSKRMMTVSFSILALWVLVRYAYRLVGGGNSLIYRVLSVNRFQCMMIGAVGACLFHRGSRVIDIVKGRLFQIVCWMLVIAYPFYEEFLPSVVIPEYISLLSIVLIIGQISSCGWINLENKVFDYLGKISYGIYVIHPLVLLLLSLMWKNLGLDLPIWQQMTLVFVLAVSATVFVAAVSYKYFESKILKYKTRFTIVNSSNSSLNR